MDKPNRNCNSWRKEGHEFVTEGRKKGSLQNLLVPVEYPLGYFEVCEDILSFIHSCIFFSVRLQREKIRIEQEKKIEDGSNSFQRRVDPLYLKWLLPTEYL